MTASRIENGINLILSPDQARLLVRALASHAGVAIDATSDDDLARWLSENVTGQAEQPIRAQLIAAVEAHHCAVILASLASALV